MSSFNAYRITQLNSEITLLKSKSDLLVDILHLHKAHLHYLDDKTDATNKLLGNILKSNIWFSSKITNATEKIFLISDPSSWKHHQISPASPFGTRSTSSWHSGLNPQSYHNHSQKMKPDALHQLHFGPLPGVGLSSLQPNHIWVQTYFKHSDGVQCKFAQTLQIFTAAPSL